MQVPVALRDRSATQSCASVFPSVPIKVNRYAPLVVPADSPPAPVLCVMRYESERSRYKLSARDCSLLALFHSYVCCVVFVCSSIFH